MVFAKFTNHKSQITNSPITFSTRIISFSSIGDLNSLFCLPCLTGCTSRQAGVFCFCFSGTPFTQIQNHKSLNTTHPSHIPSSVFRLRPYFDPHLSSLLITNWNKLVNCFCKISYKSYFCPGNKFWISSFSELVSQISINHILLMRNS